MVDRKARDQYADMVLALVSGDVSTDAFEERCATIETSGDLAITNVHGCFFMICMELPERRLTGKYALDQELLDEIDRYILFLRTDLEYEWVESSFKETILTLVTFGLYAVIKDIPMYGGWGDRDVWPFIRRSDYEEALQRAQASPHVMTAGSAES